MGKVTVEMFTKRKLNRNRGDWDLQTRAYLDAFAVQVLYRDVRCTVKRTVYYVFANTADLAIAAVRTHRPDAIDFDIIRHPVS